MNWIEIDRNICNSCGLCVKRCPRCFSRFDDRIIVTANENTCNLCGHCISLCPASAVTHSQMSMKSFVPFKKDVVFALNDFLQFIKQRRSHRHFEKTQIPRTDMEILIDICRWAPTGSNVQTVEILVIENKERIELLSSLTIDFFRFTLDEVEKKVRKMESEGKEIPEDLQLMLSVYDYRKRLVEARDSGLDPIFHRAPAVIIFHSPVLTSTPKDNCVIAAHTMALTARNMGLESCYIGLFEAAFRGSQEIRDNLGLPVGHKVYSVLILGYPLLKFRTSVDRKPVKTRWE